MGHGCQNRTHLFPNVRLLSACRKSDSALSRRNRVGFLSVWCFEVTPKPTSPRCHASARKRLLGQPGGRGDVIHVWTPRRSNSTGHHRRTYRGDGGAAGALR